MTTTATTTAKACASCAHYQATTATAGECRRNAPQTVVFQVDQTTKFESRFPSTHATAWCGEFLARTA
jgi:hypothetical protein